MQYRLGKADPLLVAFGKRGNGLVRFWREADALDGLSNLFCAGTAVVESVQPRDEIQELPHIHFWVERIVLGQVAHAVAHGIAALAHIDSVEVNGPVIGGQVAQNGLHEGGFSCAVGAQKPHDLPLGNREGDAVQGLLRAIMLSDAVNLEKHGGAS